MDTRRKLIKIHGYCKVELTSGLGASWATGRTAGRRNGRRLSDGISNNLVTVVVFNRAHCSI